MKRIFAGIALLFLAVFPRIVVSQGAATPSGGTQDAAPSGAQAAASKPATFDIADVHARAHTLFPNMSGGVLVGDRYTIHDATMVDLIATAYGINNDNVLGGPAWLETDRYDVIAKTSPVTPPDQLKLMLQDLLAERFKLVIHPDTKPVQVFVLSAQKGKPKMKESGGSEGSGSADNSGCQYQQPPTPAPGTISYIQYSCHGLTMDAFADAVHNMAGGYLTSPVVNLTGLQGTWDFDLKWTGRGQLAAAGDDGISIFDAVDRELGLKLELQKIPRPVMVVDSVNEKPTDNPPEVAKILPPPPPAEFDVAVIKPSAPDTNGIQGRISGGQVNLQGATLKFLINYAWNLNPNDSEMIVDAPKWLDQDRYDIVAKMQIQTGPDGKPINPQFDQDQFEEMLRALVIDRFKLAAHMEDRPVSAYTLMTDKPKMAKGDPTERTRCVEGPGADGKDPRLVNPMLGRLLTCQNMTMAEFAEQLEDLASGYIFVPVKDETGLEGGWDFTLSFSTAGQLQQPPGRGTDSSGGASEPTGAISLMEAVNKQLGLKLEKVVRPVPVLVIEHVEEKPTDN
jgi:uncharacterized protein (TIGR03435 family)